MVSMVARASRKPLRNFLYHLPRLRSLELQNAFAVVGREIDDSKPDREERTMAEKIGVNDIKLKYASLEDAKKMSGLRLILGANAVPGPWREACKGIFHVKKIPYTPVASAGADGSQRELIEWTAQASAPVAIWNDERPRSTWIEQLYLAERLQSEPALIPANTDDRVNMSGTINEIAGENGLGWQRRQILIDETVNNPKADDRTRNFWK